MILLYLDGSGSKFHSVNTKTGQFCQFFGVQELRKKHVNTKTSQFSIFLDSRSWEKHVCIYIYNMYICTYVWYMILLYLEGSGSKFHSVSTKTSQFCQFSGIQELRKKHVNTKTSQFPPFFGVQELTKNMSIPKLVNFPHFWIPGVEKKHVCLYIYIICIYVHMYITWFCFIWRVVVLSFIPSTPKLINFLHFLDSRNWGKTYVYIICIYVHMYITWFCHI